VANIECDGGKAEAALIVAPGNGRADVDDDPVEGKGPMRDR
jgi:hypothetical protein